MKLETNFNIICDENRYEKLISYLDNLNFKRIFIIVDKRLQNLNYTKNCFTAFKISFNFKKFLQKFLLIFLKFEVYYQK